MIFVSVRKVLIDPILAPESIHLAESLGTRAAENRVATPAERHEELFPEVRQHHLFSRN